MSYDFRPNCCSEKKSYKTDPYSKKIWVSFLAFLIQALVQSQIAIPLRAKITIHRLWQYWSVCGVRYLHGPINNKNLAA